MRRDKKDKPIPRGDLDQVAFFRAELTVYSKLLMQGLKPKQASALVWPVESTAR
jgi:hypothetical protein